MCRREGLAAARGLVPREMAAEEVTVLAAKVGAMAVACWAAAAAVVETAVAREMEAEEETVRVAREAAV